jgi:hypothetical protein
MDSCAQAFSHACHSRASVTLVTQVINQAPRLLVPRKNINAALTIQIVMLAYRFVEISIFLQKKISTFLNFLYAGEKISIFLFILNKF